MNGNSRNNPLRALAGAVLFAASLGVLAAAENRVVFQVSDGDEAIWQQALNNARAVQKALGKDKLEAEIVIYGNGIGMAKFDATTSDRLAEAVDAGIRVVACQNTMKARQLKPEDMNPKVGYVPAGVVEIIRKQQDGWSYVKP